MKTLTEADFSIIKDLAHQARINILHMTTLAASGHPGGSMSSIDVLMTLYHMINHDPNNPQQIDRDRVIISNGHISPAVYSTLGAMGYFNIEDAISEFRLAGSIFEGHIERKVPGVEWTTGNLGQGLSAGCGFALAERINKLNYHTFVLMGDGEQQKGQISEARRFAIKYNLRRLTVIIDYNQLQISGSIHAVMPQDITANWQAAGWKVISIDGHDIKQIHDALLETANSEQPCMILAHTIMGKGVSFMENQAKYHGSALKPDQLELALQELQGENKLEYYRQLREEKKSAGMVKGAVLPEFNPEFNTGRPITYTEANDNRSAWGKAIADLAQLNKDNKVPLVVFDCDLQSSVKTGDFAKIAPDRFIQCGIMEQNTCVTAGAVSTCGISAWWSDFGMFGIDEVYNNQRLNDINHANLKVVTTHVGIDVGEDGKTHQCIDYIGLARNLYHFRLLCPADPNQTDIIIRWTANQKGNFLITMGRSILPIIKNAENEIFYQPDYKFRFGKADLLREGDKAAVIVTGTPVGRVLQAVDKLSEESIKVQVWYVSCPLELDLEMLTEAAKTGIIFTVEDHNIHSGLGSIIADDLLQKGLFAKLIKLGVKEYPPSGTSEAVYQWAGLDAASIYETIKKIHRTKLVEN
ncbi:MAG TPA: transketolase [Candidatus Cloacimonadota bacterium]|nr:transketolase [Candidatus Cloacimonadota bacterium]HQL14868.1 transketolase [Candidatus Cloacimonadota bacterium]